MVNRLFVNKIYTTPAHLGESPQFETMIEGSNAQRVLADKAYASKANRDALKGKHRDGVLHKAVRGRPLRQSQKRCLAGVLVNDAHFSGGGSFVAGHIV